MDAPVVMDERDPNYDSDSLDNGDVTLETIVPHLSPEEINKHLEPIILEYYSHGDTKEVLSADSAAWRVGKQRCSFHPTGGAGA